MFKRLANIIKKRGLREMPIIILKGLFFRLGMVLSFIPKKTRSDAAEGRKIFLNRNLIYNTKGYWHVNPMPSENDLNNYYEKTYRSSFGLDFGVTKRDIRHYQILKNVDPGFDDKRKKILNFGAGNGGISIILHLLGHDVTNVEPSGMIKFFLTRWVTVKSLSEIKNIKYDLIYGSHSLEHVQDIDKTNKLLDKISKKTTIFFWEVPNANHPNSGSRLNIIDVPHTYYFDMSFLSQRTLRH